MNYKISFSEMNELAKQVNSKKPNLTLEQMREQVLRLKDQSVSKIKKQPK